MINLTAATPGWYHGVGDPPQTQRWWDGTQWATVPYRFDSDGHCTTLRPQGSVREVLWESVDFSGRATRKTFWRFIGTWGLAIVGLYFAGALLVDFGQGVEIRIGYALLIVSAAVTVLGLVPSTAAGVRRLHDTNRSGWWMTLAFIPPLNYIGLPLLIFFLTRKSQPDNLGLTQMT